MLHFNNDYSHGAHPKILAALVQTNEEALSGYGTDVYTIRAAEKILAACQLSQGKVTFLTGGTQTNALVIDSLLRSYEGVIAATTGHISVHEAGAIEFTGHKIIELPSYEGKLLASDIANYLADFAADTDNTHCVYPGMVYVSQPTELGTLYTKQELTDLHAVCQQYDIPLFIDGARLGYGLAAENSDMTLADIAQLCDVFYIGGTKVGALCGEAVVFTRDNVPQHWARFVKKHGALLAKGRLLGVQFDALFTDNLYSQISQHAMTMARDLTAILQEKGYSFYAKPQTNQLFIIVNQTQLARLSQHVIFSSWQKIDDEQTVIRLVTSWATQPEDIQALAAVL